jgi:DNA-binding IclR family transcriptional regulator
LIATVDVAASCSRLECNKLESEHDDPGHETAPGMTGSLLDRALAMLELLAAEPRGLRLQDVADRLDIPKSAAHRLLATLAAHGYARQSPNGLYLLTTKLLGLGYAWLGGSGAADLVQPALDALAAETQELVRYAITDGERLAWIAKAQGARFGLRVDPDQGMQVVLSATATGHAWLATMSEEEAVRLVMQQGFSRLPEAGPAAPRTLESLRGFLDRARARGFAMVSEVSALGTASVAAAIRHPVTGAASGVLTVSGPSARLTEARMGQLGPLLVARAAELAVATAELPLLRPAGPPPIGRGGLRPAGGP